LPLPCIPLRWAYPRLERYDTLQGSLGSPMHIVGHYLFHGFPGSLLGCAAMLGLLGLIGSSIHVANGVDLDTGKITYTHGMEVWSSGAGWELAFWVLLAFGAFVGGSAQHGLIEFLRERKR